jgi:hypothetical protein
MDIVEYLGSALILILLGRRYQVYLGMLVDQDGDTLLLEMFEQED